MAKQLIDQAIPSGVRMQIAHHLREGSARAEKGWRNAPTSEDVLTGDLGNSLRTDWSDQIEEAGYVWRWRVQYRKFGAGNQHASEEKMIGADGVFQIEVKRFKVSVLPVSSQLVSLENVEEHKEYEFHKGELFQSKRHDANDSRKLLEELNKIEQLTPGDGVFIEYGPKEYRVSLAKDVVGASGAVGKLPDEGVHRLGQFLVDRFLGCLVGVEGMYVDLDAVPQILHFPEDTTAVRKIGVRLSHALNVQVTAFQMLRFAKG